MPRFQSENASFYVRHDGKTKKRKSIPCSSSSVKANFEKQCALKVEDVGNCTAGKQIKDKEHALPLVVQMFIYLVKTVVEAPQIEYRKVLAVRVEVAQYQYMSTSRYQYLKYLYSYLIARTAAVPEKSDTLVPSDFNIKVKLDSLNNNRLSLNYYSHNQ